MQKQKAIRVNGNYRKDLRIIMDQKAAGNRKIHLEVLRILAMLFVLFHHSNWRGFMLFLYRDGFSENVYLFMSILCEVAVPLFFMISGALLLKKQESIKDILRKRILKFIIILFAITTIYHFYDVYFNNKGVGDFQTVLNAFMTNSASGALWYLYSYIALMVMLPFFRNMVKNTTIAQYIYLITLNLILVGFLPIISFALSNGQYYYTNTFNIVMATSMSFFFFLMGHFFENVVSESFYTWKNCIWLSVAGLMAILICSFLTSKRLELGLGFADSTTQGFHYTLIAIPTFSIYVWIKFIFQHFKESKWFTLTVSHIGQCTFGVYLFERILRERTEFIFDWFDRFLPCILACGLWILVMFIIGTAVVSLIKLIPGIKKYI